jgi:MAF protein
MAADPGLVLASASPRRAELLALTGWNFDRCETHADETPHPGESPVALSLRLASSKARTAQSICPEGGITLAADTLVVMDGKVMGKPHDAQDATRMLRELRGRRHTVITAIALQPADKVEIISEVCETTVPMRPYTDAEIDNYIAAGSPFDKAGAYGIQDDAFHPVEMGLMSGCYSNVMGLPICHLVRVMRKLGYSPPVGVPDACMHHTGYDCDVYTLVEKGEL